MEQNKSQFIYVIKPISRLLKEENWTHRENEIVNRHFAFLQKMMSECKLILAGKTEGLDEKTFGIVIIEADSKEEALELMKNDPGVSEGIMVGELFPYKVALLRK